MKIFRQFVLGVALLSTSVVVFAQKDLIKDARIQGNYHYMGYDVAKKMAVEARDTTFVRYFAGRLPVAEGELWTNMVEYKGHKESDRYYMFNSYNHEKSIKTGELKLREEWANTYTVQTAKNTKSVSKQFLLDGLVEEIVYEGKGKTVKCLDKEGKVLNEKGCLRYTIAPQDKREVSELHVLVVDSARKATRKKGMLPKYRLTNLVADYESQSWKVYQEFPTDFDKNSPMYERIKAAVENAFKGKKVDDIYYDKDINGNYYNNIYFMQGAYN